MARGDIVTIANGATALRPLADAAQSLVVNNRNNGLVYVAADELPTVLFFDYIVPPNSSARLPGVFRETVGVLYQDLTGAGTAGQVELYRSNRVVDAPEYGPLGATSPTSFANVDLAQVATPSAPASGFSRLFASAVDQQLWYELPSGTLIPVSQQAKLQLRSIASTDLLSNTAGVGNAITDISTNASFTIDDANSQVLVVAEISLVVNMGGVSAQFRVEATIDNGGSVIPVGAINLAANATTSNMLSSAGADILTLSAGSHNIKFRYFASGSSTLNLRAGSNSAFEWARLLVMECKR